jgi:hypothetical protein
LWLSVHCTVPLYLEVVFAASVFEKCSWLRSPHRALTNGRSVLLCMRRAGGQRGRVARVPRISRAAPSPPLYRTAVTSVRRQDSTLVHSRLPRAPGTHHCCDRRAWPTRCPYHQRTWSDASAMTQTVYYTRAVQLALNVASCTDGDGHTAPPPEPLSATALPHLSTTRSCS